MGGAWPRSQSHVSLLMHSNIANRVLGGYKQQKIKKENVLTIRIGAFRDGEATKASLQLTDAVEPPCIRWIRPLQRQLSRQLKPLVTDVLRYEPQKVKCVAEWVSWKKLNEDVSIYEIGDRKEGATPEVAAAATTTATEELDAALVGSIAKKQDCRSLPDLRTQPDQGNTGTGKCGTITCSLDTKTSSNASSATSATTTFTWLTSKDGTTTITSNTDTSTDATAKLSTTITLSE